MAEREVVFHRIDRIETTERCGDVARHRPAGTCIARELQAAADADDVGIERYDQLRRRNARPHAQIERVVSDHPAQEQIQTLAARPR